MTILVLPDTHGRDQWKSVVNTTIFDKIVFLGDYFDSFNITGHACRNNFIDILSFKKNNPDKVILLAGNHDNHYIWYHSPEFKYVKCSGFSASAAWKNNLLLLENRRFLQAAWKHEKYLFSHAGITEKHYIKDIRPLVGGETPIDGALNTLWKSGNPIIFKCSFESSGNDDCSSLFWTRPAEMLRGPLEGFHQIVGHTPVDEVTYYNLGTSEVTFTDCVEYRKQEFLVINV